jgi:hydrophobe/amphiphile efflux-3 (HAE3) family protein
MSFFARLCRDHARAVVLVCVLLTIPVAIGASFIEVKAGQKDLIPTKYETSRTLEDVDRLFGGINNEIPMVESDAMLTYPMIKKFLLLEDEMVKAVGKDSYVYMEHFLTGFARNALNEAKKQYGPLVNDVATIMRFGEGTEVPSPMNPAETVPFEQAIEEGVALYLANPVAYKWTVEKQGSALLSADGRYATAWIKVNPEYDSSQRKDFASEVEGFFHDYFEGGEVPASVYVSGDPSIDKDLEDYVLSSTWLLAVIAVALLMILLYLTFQRFTDVLLPMMVIALTAIWIYGIMGWLHLPYTVLSALIGPLVLGISLGNLVYMMSRFYEEFGTRKEPRKAAYKAVITVGVAIFLACVTTVFGFASFGFSDFDVLQQFGYLTAGGIGICFIFSVTFLPALMVLREERRLSRGTSRLPRGVKIFARTSDLRIDRFLGRVAGISQGSPRAVVVVYAFIVFICIMGTFRLSTTPDLRALAPQDIPSLQAQYLEESIFGGQQEDVILLTGDVLAPEALAAMRGFQEEIARSPYFSENGSSSIGELIQDFRAETGKAGADGTGALPVTAAEAEADVAEIGALFGPQEGKLVSEDHRAALISIFSEGAQSNQVMMDKDRILKEAAANNFGAAGIAYEVGGITPLTAELLGNLVPTQIETSILALVLSGLVLVLVFRSLTYGLAALSVLVAGITVELGFLALMGWTLDMMTVLVVSMIIGMGIDYGIHVTHRFLEEQAGGEVSVAEALNTCIIRVGKPLMASTVCTAGAFLVISFSQMQPMRRFGLITALSLTVSFAASLLVLPSIITLIARRRQLEEEETPAEAVGLKPAEADNRA